MSGENSGRRNPIRRLGGYLLDTFAMGGTARAGVNTGGRGTSVLQTRPVMDAMLSTTTFEDEQPERQRAVWSTVGSVLLGALGIFMLVYALPLGHAFWIGIGAVEVIIGLLVLRTVSQHSTRGSVWHVAGVIVLAAAAIVPVLAPPPLFGDWQLALPALAASIAAGICLMIGRRD